MPQKVHFSRWKPRNVLLGSAVKFELQDWHTTDILLIRVFQSSRQLLGFRNDVQRSYDSQRAAPTESFVRPNV